MPRFANINGVNVNVDYIKKFCITGEYAIVELMNGEVIKESFSRPSTAERIREDIFGEKHIIQVIQAQECVYAVYKDEQSKSDDKYWAYRVFYLGLTADGEVIRLLIDSEGAYPIDDCGNYVGTFTPEELKKFEKVEIFDNYA